MARCPDCNKFVSDEVSEDVQPDFSVDEVRDEAKLSDDPAELREVVVVVSMTANIERNCMECGTTLKQLQYEGTTEVTLHLPDPPLAEDALSYDEPDENGNMPPRSEVNRRWDEYAFDVEDDGAEVEEAGKKSKPTLKLVANGTVKATVKDGTIEETFNITDEHAKSEFEDY
jgi:hypothetical protein